MLQQQEQVVNDGHSNEHSIYAYMEMFLIAAWETWKLRNSVIFDDANPSIHLWTIRFKDQVQLYLLRFNHDTNSSVLSWLLSF